MNLLIQKKRFAGCTQYSIYKKSSLSCPRMKKKKKNRRQSEQLSPRAFRHIGALGINFSGDGGSCELRLLLLQLETGYKCFSRRGK